MTTVGIFHGLLGGIGGAERLAVSLANGLIKSGYQVKVYAASLVDDRPTKLFSETMPQEAEIVTFMNRRIRVKAFAIYQNLLSEYFIRRVEGESDVVVQTGGGYQPIIKSKRRRIAYCHGVWTHEGLRHDNKYQRGLWKLYFMPVGWVMKRRFARISKANLLFVANSNYTRQHLLDVWKVNESDLHMVYPPINIANWKANNSERSGIVNVSRFSQEKKHTDMFEIVKELDTSLTIIGNATNFTNEIYLRRIRQVAPINVKFLKNIADRQISEQLHNAKVYLHTSKETFGMTVVEAIAAGCIPVVPNNSAHQETVPFPELRYDSIASARQIIQDALNGKFDKLLPALHSHIRQFDEEVFHKKMKAIIEMVLNGRAS